jgi:hypothetical protein
MKKFTLWWLTGDREVIEGETIANAFSRAGYGGGAMSALDFYSEGEDDSYEYNKENKRWEKKS